MTLTLAQQAQNALDRDEYENALDLAEQSLKHSAENWSAYLVAAQACLFLSDHEQCIKHASRALALSHQHAGVLNLRAAAQERLGRLNLALEDYAAACSADPMFFDAQLNKATCLTKLGRLEDAAAEYQGIAHRLPESADAHFGLGNACDALGKKADAVAAYREAVRLDPAHGLAWYNLGNVLMDQLELEQAVEAFGHASTCMPNFAAVYNNCANAFKLLKQNADALMLFDAACAVEPDNAEVRYNRLLHLIHLRRWVRAVEACADLLRLDAKHAAAYNCLGIALNGLRQHPQALDAFEKALQHDPAMAEAYANKAGALELMHRHEEALEAYEKVIEINPDYKLLAGRMGYRRLYVCSWQNFKENQQMILRGVEAGKQVCDPFRILAFSDSAQIHQAVARKWTTSLRAPTDEGLPPLVKSNHPKIKVGYFSADFHLHATSLLMAQFFELHDRDRFELIGFSFGASQQDTMSERIRSSFDRYLDVRAETDEAVVRMAREMGLDIAVDLKGFTLDSRIGIFQLRAAPIQISYLGFPGTLGADFMDYIIADYNLIPDELRDFYDEKVIRIPGSYQANDQHRVVASTTPSRRELGLPDEAFVFCCFNNNYKITPDVFDVWMRLLHRVDGSVLWLLSDSEAVIRNLKASAAERGISPDRLIFASRTGVPEHLARQKAANLFLDTVPCNAHTTASDALWVGLPVLTCPGTSFASRVATSLLRAQGLDQLVADSLESYEAKAYELATNVQALRSIRNKVQASIKNGQLFDTPALTRSIERAYVKAKQLSDAGHAPEHIDV